MSKVELKDEEDTFRILSRRPLNEVKELVFQRIMLGFIKTETDFEEAVKSLGYTVVELRDE